MSNKNQVKKGKRVFIPDGDPNSYHKLGGNQDCFENNSYPIGNRIVTDCKPASLPPCRNRNGPKSSGNICLLIKRPG